MTFVQQTEGKWCSGPSHESPVYLPRTEEFFYFYKSGRKKGKPHGWCRTCHTWNGFYSSALVPCPKIYEYVMELVYRCGTRVEAAKYAGIGVSTIFKITNYGQCTVQVPTAQKLLLALDRRRREDRIMGATPTLLLEHRRQAARTEDYMEHSKKTRPRVFRAHLAELPPSHYFEE